MTERTEADQAVAALKHYHAALDEMAAKKKIGRNMLHKELKKQLGIKHLSDLSVEELSEVAWTLESEAAAL